MAAVVPAHIQAPPNIVLKQSLVDEDRIGAFCQDETIRKDMEFGPFKGKIVHDKYSDVVDQKFSWEVYDLESFKFLHTVDATNEEDGNWMRYVCCARFFEEQNIVSNQNGTDVYYRALKDINPGEELLTWFQAKKKRKRSSLRDSKESLESTELSKDPIHEDTGLGAGKRKRKPKVIPDSYQGPIEFKVATKRTKRTEDNALFEPLQPGQKRRRRKKVLIDPDKWISSSPAEQEEASLPETDVQPESKKKSCESAEKGIDAPSKSLEIDFEKVEFEEMEDLKKLQTIKKENGKPLNFRECNKLVDWKFPEKGEEYVFEIKKHHRHQIAGGRKAFKCDICMGLYKQMFSLKRHYLRAHINYKFLSKTDIGSCSINLVYVKRMLYERAVLNEFKLEKKNDVGLEGKDSFFEKLDKAVLPLHTKTTMQAQDKIESEQCTEECRVNQNCSENCSGLEKSVTLADSNDLCLKIKEEVADPYFNELEVAKKTGKVNGVLENKDNESQNAVTVGDIGILDGNSLSKSGFDHCNVGKTEKVIDKDSMEANKSIDETSNNKLTISEIDRKQHKNLEEALLEIKRENEEMETNDILDETSDQEGEMETSDSTKLNDESDESTEDTQKEASDKTEASTVNSEDSKKNPKMLGLYRCYTCYAVYDTVQEIRDHLEDHPDQALSFVCETCNMRFHFKHNLFRHKKVHDGAKKAKKIWAKQMGDDGKIAVLKKKKMKKMTEQETNKPATKKVDLKNMVIEPKGTSDNLFKCYKCRTIYPNQHVLTVHVQTDHKDGAKFMCQYCGKDFPSMPNMKKHVRFHLGYRVRCRVCDDIFSNVGALRKHTRLVHPDIYKARRLDKLARDGALRLSDKKLLKNSKVDSVKVLDKKQLLIKKKSLVNSDTPVKEEQQEKIKTKVAKESLETVQEDSKSSDEFLLEHDITFEAHEIDDGGSRFKFSCTVCKKRFSSYINMCRHRRKVHSENKQKLEEGLIFTRKSKTLTPPVVEDRKELELFYANVSHNIAINLNCFIDGTPESLEKYTQHIKIDNYKSGSFGYSDHSPHATEISWEQYNFPPDFKPVLTVPVSDIKTESEGVDADIQDNLKTATRKDSGNVVCNGDITPIDFENSEIEANVGIGTDLQHDYKIREEIDQTSEPVEQDKMGKSSTGIKALASVGFSAMQKIAKSLENLTGDSTSREEQTPLDDLDMDLLQRNSPSSKNFGQVKNGEYANFDDLMLGDDFTTVARTVEVQTRGRAHSAASSRMSKKFKYKRSHSAGDLIDSDPVDDCYNSETSQDLCRASQLELESLYEDLDIGVERDIPQTITSPIRLSHLCEGMLQLKASDGKNMCPTTSNVESHLLTLSLNKCSENNAVDKVNRDQKPDYSDATVDSPFYNYESIVFGRNGEIMKICAVCKKHFADFESLLHHHRQRHPSSACNYLEVEDGNDIESLHFAHPSTVGVLAVTDPGLDGDSDKVLFTCTHCRNVFKSKARLHVHIVNCSPIDPIYGAIKTPPSPVKSPLKNNLLHKYQGSAIQNDLKMLNINSQKRVFTGCRKRTAMLLPDSPIKMIFGDKHVQDILSGYNPNNHIRRRELTELVDTLTCEGCGQKFKTIILLERHVKNCAEKEKFKNVRPLTCPIMDESLAKIKNICFYCDKNFTYAKSLMNHFQDFCPVKKSKVDNGNLTNDDKVKEKEIMVRLQKQEEEKVMKDKEMDGQKKRSWQVGRKPKRKGHSWTYIKKRKQLSLSSSDNLQDEDEEEEMNEEGSGDVGSDESMTNVSAQNIGTIPDTVTDHRKQSEEKNHDANGNFVHKAIGRAGTFDEVDSCSASRIGENFSVSPDIQDENKDDLFKTEVTDSADTGENGNIQLWNDQESAMDSNMEKKHRDSLGLNEYAPNWDRDANTSLDFTTRYKVNHTSVPKKEMSRKPSLLQCVMPYKKTNDSYQLSFADKAERSKRKRERCGKVEAFLQNVFKRKKKKEALMQKTQNGGIVRDTDTATTENVKLLEANVLETIEKGNTLLDPNQTNINTKSPTLHNEPESELSPLYTDFSIQVKDITEEMNEASPLPSIEVRREESGNIRYLFKRGRPRKHPKVETNNVKGLKACENVKELESEAFQKTIKSPGRGRPRKCPKQVKVEKKTRGRPAKIKSESSKDKEVKESANFDDCDQLRISKVPKMDVVDLKGTDEVECDQLSTVPESDKEDWKGKDEVECDQLSTVPESVKVDWKGTDEVECDQLSKVPEFVEVDWKGTDEVEFDQLSKVPESVKVDCKGTDEVEFDQLSTVPESVKVDWKGTDTVGCDQLTTVPESVKVDWKGTDDLTNSDTISDERTKTTDHCETKDSCEMDTAFDNELDRCRLDSGTKVFSYETEIQTSGLENTDNVVDDSVCKIENIVSDELPSNDMDDVRNSEGVVKKEINVREVIYKLNCDDSLEKRNIDIKKDDARTLCVLEIKESEIFTERDKGEQIVSVESENQECENPSDEVTISENSLPQANEHQHEVLLNSNDPKNTDKESESENKTVTVVLETDSDSEPNKQTVGVDKSICDSDDKLGRESVHSCEGSDTETNVIMTEVISDPSTNNIPVQQPLYESLTVIESEANNPEKDSQKKAESVAKEEENTESMYDDMYSAVILSPSERVKTNKRSCKKLPSPYSPIWVKQQKPRIKSGTSKSDSKVCETGTGDEKTEQLAESEVQEASSKLILDAANSDLFKKGIPKALKRKMEIVSRFDNSKKKMLKNT